MAWTKLTDAMVAAYVPITGRLLRALRDNLKAMRVFHTNTNLLGTLSASTSSLSMVTLFTIRLFVPDSLIGPNGVTITFKVALQESGAEPPNHNGRARLEVGSDTSSNYTSAATEMSITLTGVTPNSAIDIEFQAYVIDAGHSFQIQATKKAMKVVAVE